MRLLLFAIAVLCACRPMSISTSEVRDDELTPTAVSSSAILETLTYVFYRGNPTPPPPTADELAKAEAAFAELTGQEKTLLEKIYGDRYSLMALAARDTDGDGIKDFRVSHYYGKFHEGDLDLDNDGIRNIYDINPYDPQIGGRDANGDGIPDSGFVDENNNRIPDHIDWSLTMEDRPQSASMIASQKKLFDRHKIILVERSADFNASTVQAIEDAILLVFGGVFAQQPVLPTLRTIASEDIVLVIPEEGGETNAMVMSFSNTMVVYKSGLNASPLVRLGLLVHELGHNLQYAQDYASDSIEEGNRTYYPQPVFFGSLSPWGWETDRSTESSWQPFTAFTPIYEIVRPRFTYQQKGEAEWTEFVNAAWEEYGGDYLSAPSMQEKYIVSDYSLTDPYEWESDNLIAYVFNRMEVYGAQNMGFDRAELANRMASLISIDWPGFLHTNFEGSPFSEHFSTRYPLSEDAVSTLAQRYLTPIMQSGMQLTGYGKRSGHRCSRHRD